MDNFSTSFWNNAQSLCDGIRDNDFSSSFVPNTKNVYSSYSFDLELFETRIGEAASRDMDMFGDALNLIGKTKLEDMTENMIFLGVCRGKVVDTKYREEGITRDYIDTIESFLDCLKRWASENDGSPVYPYGPFRLNADPKIVKKMADFLIFWILHWDRRRAHCLTSDYRHLYDKVSDVVNSWN